MNGRSVRQEMKYALRGGLSVEHQKLMIDCDAIMSIKIAERTPEQLELLISRSAPLIILNRKFSILTEQMFPKECRALKIAKAER
jgi:hydrogenase maturation factor HypF (carbamoyltransferase family)